MNKKLFLSLMAVLLVLLGGAIDWWSQGQGSQSVQDATFDGQKALQDVEYQVSLGPRIPDSGAHAQEVDWIVSELKKNGWAAEVQTSVQMGHPVKNIVGKRGNGQPWIILGAHYDSRLHADHDPDPAKQQLPVPGADDGASGVSVLLELARTLPRNLDKQIWLVFFDAEDNGDIPGWDWLLGSKAFVANLSGKPDEAVVVDMVGDANLNIYLDSNSNSQLSAAIWGQAAQLGYSSQFIPFPKYAMYDDHIPFIQGGIPAVDIIDFDYPYWHTTEDTADKVSAESMKVVGDTLLAWLTQPASR